MYYVYMKENAKKDISYSIIAIIILDKKQSAYWYAILIS